MVDSAMDDKIWSAEDLWATLLELAFYDQVSRDYGSMEVGYLNRVARGWA